MRADRPRPTFGSAPTTLANQEATAENFGVDFAGLFVHNGLLGLYHSTRLALIIDTNDSVPQLELPSRAGGRKGLEDRQFTLAVDSMAVIQLRDPWNVSCLLACVEVGHLLVGELESWIIVFREYTERVLVKRWQTYAESMGMLGRQRS